MKAIKNDYDTNVMYDIAKVVGKLHIYVSHHPKDLSTVLIPNDGSLEESFVAQGKLEIYINHVGVNFIIAKYICLNASLAEMTNHVITDYTGDGEDERKEVTQNDYAFDQMVELEEQEHFENEETKEVQLQKPVRMNRIELEAEVTLANKLLCEFNGYVEQMRSHEIQIMMLHKMPIMSLNSYSLHTLLMTHEADMRTANNLTASRQELLRSIDEKQNLINNYIAI
ncbi:hypothetical protein Tco_0104087 [Tanacetum coccineum]